LPGIAHNSLKRRLIVGLLRFVLDAEDTEPRANEQEVRLAIRQATEVRMKLHTARRNNALVFSCLKGRNVLIYDDVPKTIVGKERIGSHIHLRQVVQLSHAVT
jgi:hypothetical protein